MQKARDGSAAVLIGSMGAILAAKLFLVWPQPVKAVASGSFDDALFIEMARHLSLGNWLGDYTNVTLAKGPGAPMFMAACHSIGLPLPIAQHLLHALACALVVLALRPAVRSTRWLPAAYAFMLFHPVTYDTGVMTRVGRTHVYAATILICLASLAGLATWRRAAPRSRTAWVAAAGLSGGFMWITREETVVVLPGLIVLVLGAAIWLARDGSRGEALAHLFDCAIAFGIGAALVGTVALTNRANYGAFVVTEIRSGAFPDALAALSRVPPVAAEPTIASTEESRRAAYQLSPAMAELAPYLEGPEGRAWIERARHFTGVAAEGNVFHHGWFLWAIRDAAARAGRHDSPAAAAAFYTRVAAEINAACADPAARCEPPGSGLHAKLTPERAKRVAAQWARNIAYAASFPHFSAYSSRSIGTNEEMQPFRTMTGWPVAPVDSDPPGGARVAVLHAIGRAAGRIVPLLSLAALALWLRACLEAWTRRAAGPLTIVPAAALVLVLAVTGVVALVDVLAFPAGHMLYLAPASEALWLFLCATGLGALRVESEAR